MPYHTERGVTIYADHDTPSEYATGEDEDRAAYNEAQDAAYSAADALLGLIDGLHEPQGNVVIGRVALVSATEKLTRIHADILAACGRAVPDKEAA